MQRPAEFLKIRSVGFYSRAWALIAWMLLFPCCNSSNGESEGGSDGNGADSDNSDNMSFFADGETAFGDWSAAVSSPNESFKPGDEVSAEATITLGAGYLDALAEAGYPVDALFVLLTAERTYDADGRIHFASDENISTLLTPSGLAIEGGTTGPVTTRFGYVFHSPLEVYQEVFLTNDDNNVDEQLTKTFEMKGALPDDLPPGLYRLRADFGIRTSSRTLNLNASSLSRPFSTDLGVFTYCFSPPIPASGKRIDGTSVDGADIKARVPWLLFANDNSNGYAGVIADEDRSHFALSPRNIIPDEVVLPLYSDGTNVKTYSLEPLLPADASDLRGKVDWDWTKGELSLEVTDPDGKTEDYGTAPITGKAVYPEWYTFGGPTTGGAAFTAWKPTKYGQYTVKLKGWMEDTGGRRYEGGGTYKFWIAKRMTLATATFQGMSYPVGTKYGRDIAFSPPVPAEVEVTVTLFPSSDPEKAKSVTYGGTATRAGIFGVAQGLKPFEFTEPGEYHAKILAKYTDANGDLFVSPMRHAGVVYPTSPTIEAHGKMIADANGTYVERGETGKEGWKEADGTSHLEHLTFPYNPGDVMLIASEGQGTNKIEPVMLYSKAGESAWDSKYTGVGTSNLVINTSNGYSPHLFPEYITDWQYYYGAGARPGFMSRFIVGESNTRAPYWPTSQTSFGSQIGASSNGDLPGDIYRLIGGVVVRDQGSEPAYAGYLASAFILPGGTNNNRIIEPGTEDLIGPTGAKARFFLVGVRPGMTYEVGDTFRPAGQVDPLLPASVTFELIPPTGDPLTQTVEASGGSFAGGEEWTFDMPGIYRYNFSGSWNGFTGVMPGLPANGGFLFVATKKSDRPEEATGLVVDLPPQSTFTPDGVFMVRGKSTAATIYYTLLMPGCVLDIGNIEAADDGTFEYLVDPTKLNKLAPIYDIKNNATGEAKVSKILHLTLFAMEKADDGTEFWDMRRVIFRGTTVLNTH